MGTYNPLLNAKAYIPQAYIPQAYIPQAYIPQAYIQQSYKSTINGKVIEDDAVRAVYDGNQAIVDIYDNGKKYHSKLNKKDIEQIFSMKKHPLTLEKRLIKDFGLKGKKTRKHKNKGKKVLKGKKSIKRGKKY